MRIKYDFLRRNEPVPEGLRIVTPDQTHSDIAKYISTFDKEIVADSLVTGTAGLKIGVNTADCVPIFIYDQVKPQVAVIHAGYKGLLVGIIENTIALLLSKGSLSKNLKAVIGPSIGPCCYEVKGERMNLFEKRFGKRVIRCDDNKCFLNLQKCATILLVESGIPRGKIDLDHYECTSCKKQKYDSYFRDKKWEKRLISYIWIE